MPKTKMETLKQQYDEMMRLFKDYQEKLVYENDPKAAYILRKKIDKIRSELQVIENEINALKAVETIVSVQGDVHVLQTKIDEPKLTESLDRKLAELLEQYQQVADKPSTKSPLSGFEPRLSVLRPNVRLVDANLAYKYVDLQSDVNILFGFTTLFLGVAISSGISLGIEKVSSQQDSAISIYLTVLVMSVLVSVIFGYLTYRSYQKSTQVKIQLETDAEVNEIGLGLIDELPGAAKTKPK